MQKIINTEIVSLNKLKLLDKNFKKAVENFVKKGKVILSGVGK